MVKTSGDCLAQPPCSKQANCSRLLRALSRQVLSISKDGDCTMSLHNLLQCMIALTVKYIFLMFQWKFPVFHFVPTVSCPFTVLLVRRVCLHPSGPIDKKTVPSLILLFLRMNSPHSLSPCTTDALIP